ncbi:MAG: FAD-dependent oxidoreductase [Candidatus Poribacteria bacterium]
MKHKNHKVDLCVVGGGLAGMLTAIASARHGAKVLLMQDRPVLGGNASSEVRMWIGGAHGKNNRETGILEEIMLENLYRNPYRVYSIWDSILYEKVKFEDNITLLLNCSCNDAEMDGNTIRKIKGWQLTTETWHTVEASLFADCSGDSILAPLSGAEFRMGRESAYEFNEDIEPEIADKKTMGMSCLIQARETDSPKKFIPPSWAYKYTSDDDLPYRGHDVRSSNFWWIELGGEQDTIHDTESIRDELLKVAFGIWDHIKNYGDHGADNWVLDWVGFLPGKRESRRYVGDYTLTQNDVRAEGRFDDIVAYGGWSMDDHHPGGMNWKGQPTIFHPAPSPYGIPYRCLYSKNINNLLFAGRNISATHASMSSTRVMATCAVIGQAVGTASAIAIKYGLSPRGVYQEKLKELQQTLMDDDCYLPWKVREIPDLSKSAQLSASEGDPEVLRNGIDRSISDIDNGWTGKISSWIQYSFTTSQEINEFRFIFDSDLNRKPLNMPCNYPLNPQIASVPRTMTKSFRIDFLDDSGSFKTLFQEDNNYQRLVRIKKDIKTKAVRFVPLETWGSDDVHLFAWDVR